MKLIKKISIGFALLITFLAHAQEEKLPSYFSNNSLNTEQISTLVYNNAKNTTVETSLSTISLKQIGNENVVKIENKQALGTQKVYQLGNSNNYKFTNYNNNITVNLGVIQTGNANSLNIVGTNSLFKNLNITQFGGAKMEILNY